MMLKSKHTILWMQIACSFIHDLRARQFDWDSLVRFAYAYGICCSWKTCLLIIKSLTLDRFLHNASVGRGVNCITSKQKLFAFFLPVLSSV
jgi:hypothetical protein